MRADTDIVEQLRRRAHNGIQPMNELARLDMLAAAAEITRLRAALAQAVAAPEAGPVAFRVSVQPLTASNGTTHVVCIDHPTRPLDAAPWDGGRMTPSQHKDPAHAAIEAEAWREFFANSGCTLAEIVADSVASAAPVAQQGAEPRDPHRGSSSYEASMLRNLLARIHGDGGHYVEQHGLDKALSDADEMVAEWRAAHAQQPAALTDAPNFISHMSADFSCDGGGVRVYIASRVDEWLRAHGITTSGTKGAA